MNEIIFLVEDAPEGGFSARVWGIQYSPPDGFGCMRDWWLWVSL